MWKIVLGSEEMLEVANTEISDMQSIRLQADRGNERQRRGTFIERDQWFKHNHESQGLFQHCTPVLTRWVSEIINQINYDASKESKNEVTESRFAEQFLSQRTNNQKNFRNVTFKKRIQNLLWAKIYGRNGIERTFPSKDRPGAFESRNRLGTSGVLSQVISN